MKITRRVERWSPVVVIVAVLLLWQLVVTAFGIAEYIFPSPWQIALQFIEYQSALLEAAWKTFWVTMLGFAVSIVVGVMLGFLIGRVFSKPGMSLERPEIDDAKRVDPL